MDLVMWGRDTRVQLSVQTHTGRIEDICGNDARQLRWIVGNNAS